MNLNDPLTYINGSPIFSGGPPMFTKDSTNFGDRSRRSTTRCKPTWAKPHSPNHLQKHWSQVQQDASKFAAIYNNTEMM